MLSQILAAGTDVGHHGFACPFGVFLFEMLKDFFVLFQGEASTGLCGVFCGGFEAFFDPFLEIATGEAQEVAEDGVLCGLGNGEMKLQVVFQELIREVEGFFHSPDGVFDGSKVFICGTLRGQVCGLRFEHEAGFQQVLYAFGIQEKAQAEGFFQVPTVGADKGTFAYAAVQDAHHREGAQGFSERGATHAKAFAEFTFGGQAVSGLECAPGDEVYNTRHDFIAERCAYNGFLAVEGRSRFGVHCGRSGLGHSKPCLCG